jgi:hypothetical protein
MAAMAILAMSLSGCNSIIYTSDHQFSKIPQAVAAAHFVALAPPDFT